MPYVVLCKQFVSIWSLIVDWDANLAGWTSVMLNDHSMYEHILEDDIFFGVVGMLECMFCSLFHITH
jgi:hypothetical protein